MTFLLEQIAQPQLSSRRLEVLATHDDPAVRATVAANPSTPPAALLSLLGEFPALVLGNPALVLHQIADPGLFGRADAGLQERWARHPDMPAWLLTELSHSEDDAVRDAVAVHANTPAAVVERLVFPDEVGAVDDGDDREPCRSAIQNPALPPGLAFDIAVTFVEAVDPDDEEPAPPAMLAMLLLDATEAGEYTGDREDSPLDGLWAVRLSVDDDNSVVDEEGWGSLVWRCPEGPYALTDAWDDVCTGVSEDDDEQDEEPGGLFSGDDEATIWGMTSDELACHRAAPWHLVRRRCHRDPTTLAEAMSRPDMPVNELARLASVRSPRVRCAVASHPSTPDSVLASLARSTEPLIRLRVAYHPGAPAGALTVLASDTSATIRRAVAANEATPDEVRERLTHDRWASVRRVAAGLRHSDDEGCLDESDEDAYGDA